MPTPRPLLPLLALVAVVLAGCGDGGGGSASPEGLRRDDLLAGASDDRCPVTEQLETALADADLPAELEPADDPYGSVSAQDGSGDDAADSTILSDTHGADLRCRFETDADSTVELRVFLLGPTEGRKDYRDEVAWTWVLGRAKTAANALGDDLGDVEAELDGAGPGSAVVIGTGPGQHPVGIAVVRAEGTGSSAALHLAIDEGAGTPPDAAQVRAAAASLADALGDD